ncbi:hypothetical protein MLD38_032459 [Melastoma candidum]|uniref:Uncharacterized protein n=1 Tax=Melastoma candidum TaxID=119954 RepID=A0ACB9M3T0_9MYRT|nr:hypothetical protein MLD38_032459 [Melastoma candidum]
MARSLSTVFLSHPLPHPQRTRLQRPHPLPSLQLTAKFSQTPSPPPPTDQQPPPPPRDKKSFSIAVGEVFLGITSLLMNRGRRRRRRSSGRRRTPKDGSGSILFGDGDYEEEDEEEDDRSGVGGDEVVVWEQRRVDVEAERKRKVVTSPGFSFSAAGLLFPYHLGVADFLLQNGYIKETTPLAGSSAGAIVCAVIASGASMQEALKATKILGADCRSKGTAFRLGAVLRQVLENFLPVDAHVRCSGRVRVAVTQVLWRPRGLLVDQFDSRADLINAVVTSSFIPGYLAPTPVTLFRNRLCIDGGLTLFMPPTSAAHTVRVCAFPAARLGLEGIGISPDLNPEFSATPRELFNWALEPAEDHMLDMFFELGRLDAAAWAAMNPTEEVVEDDLVGNGVSSC